ncbi:Tn3 family transposase [Streptomyces sp. NPDC001165]|uniref:Tn3 family transposase n=1 Tax=Streptomyces sp. NPDC001165 TaxID=3364546 RepID=UPI00368A7432
MHRKHGCGNDLKNLELLHSQCHQQHHALEGADAGRPMYPTAKRKNVCIYSQLKSCSSSEVAAMIEGLLRHDTRVSLAGVRSTCRCSPCTCSSPRCSGPTSTRTAPSAST